VAQRVGECQPGTVERDEPAEDLEQGLPALVRAAGRCGGLGQQQFSRLIPALQRIAIDRPGELKLAQIDVDASPRLSQRFEVRAVPTLMVWRGGELLARQPGAAPEPALRSWLDQALKSKGSEDR
jgi:hypothetical protein